MKLNKTVEKKTFAKKFDEAVKTDGELNFMAGLSFSVNDPFVRLQMMAASCFFGEPSYYGDAKPFASKGHSGIRDDFKNALGECLFGDDPYANKNHGSATSIVKTINDCLNVDVEKTLQVAVELRDKDHIRLTPQVILVLAANHPASKGTGLIAKYGNEIMARLDEVGSALAIQMKMFGKPIPNGLKKAMARRMERASKYELAKYRMENSEIKLVDVMNVAHPRGDVNASINELAKGTLKLGDEQKTWESIRSKGGSWAEAVEVMGHMALLRNLRNLDDSNAFNKHEMAKILDKLIAGVEKGKQLPFRYYTASEMISNDQIKLALEKCMDESIKQFNLQGPSAIFTDNSGSAHGAVTSESGNATVADINNLFAAMLYKITGGQIGVFGDNIEYVMGGKNILATAKQCGQVGKRIGHSTETGLFLGLSDMINNGTFVDRIVILSDMQAGTGGLYGYNNMVDRTRHKTAMDLAWRRAGDHVFYNVPALFKHYQKTINPNCQMYCVQTAGYSGSLFPAFYKTGVHIIGGWSENLIKYICKMESIIKN